MHILLLTHYYPPEVNAPASRCSENARAWVAAGHRVTVVTCAPNHPAGQVLPGYKNRLFQHERIDGVDVIRVWTWLAANEGFLPRIAGYVSYLVSVVLQRFRIPRADVVVSTSPQFFAGLAGWAFKSRTRPWVLEIRDLWPESIVAVGAMRHGTAIRLIERIEAAAYRAADRVVVVTDSFVEHIRARRPVGPIDVVKNGVDLTHFLPAAAADVAAFRAEYGLTGKFVAAYVGTHGMAHGLDTILSAAEMLRERADIIFLLVGAGAEKARLEAERDRRGLNNVVMLGQQPKSVMPTVWSATDAALVLLRAFDTFRSVIPSKMFEAMALAKPIVLGVAGEAAAIMETGRAGIAIPPEDAAALGEAVRKLADDETLAARLGVGGRTYVRVEFDRAVLAKRYLAVLEAAVAAKT